MVFAISFLLLLTILFFDHLIATGNKYIVAFSKKIEEVLYGKRNIRVERVYTEEK